MRSFLSARAARQNKGVRKTGLAIAGLLAGSTIALADLPAEPHSAVPPFISASTGWHRVAQIDSGAGSVRTREYRLELGLRRVDFDAASLDFGIDYEYSHLELANIGSRNRDMHRLLFPVRFAVSSERIRWRGHVTPGIATSSNVFKDFVNRGSSDDLVISGRVEIGGASPWFAGIAYDRTFGKPKLFPVAGVDVNPQANLRLRIAFPDSGAWLQLSDRHALSARLYPSGERWRVVTDDFQDEFDLRREEWRFQLTWDIAVTRYLSLALLAGQSFDRRLRLSNDTGTRIDATVSQEPFAEFGFRLAGSRKPQ